MSFLKTVPCGTCMSVRERIVSVLCWWSAETSGGATWARMHPISAPTAQPTAAEIESREGCISAVFCLWIFVPAFWRGSLFSLKVILRVEWQSFSTPRKGPLQLISNLSHICSSWQLHFAGNPYLLRGSAWVMGGLRTGMLSEPSQLFQERHYAWSFREVITDILGNLSFWIIVSQNPWKKCTFSVLSNFLLRRIPLSYHCSFIRRKTKTTQPFH